MGMADEIVSKTKDLAFSPANISHPFDSSGPENTIAAMSTLNGKELQASYRAPFGESAKYTEKVTGR
jgi:hypothetical protein